MIMSKYVKCYATGLAKPKFVGKRGGKAYEVQVLRSNKPVKEKPVQDEQWVKDLFMWKKPTDEELDR